MHDCYFTHVQADLSDAVGEGLIRFDSEESIAPCGLLSMVKTGLVAKLALGAVAPDAAFDVPSVLC